MKVCLIAPTPPPNGGVANWSRILIKEIKSHEDVELTHIDIAANKRPTEGRNFYDRFIYSGFKMVRAYNSLRHLVNNSRPDVVHMTTSGGFGFVRDLIILHLAHRKKLAIIYHIHFGRAVEYKEKSPLKWFLLNCAVGLATETIVIDKKTEMILKNIFDNINYINNPIDLKEFQTLTSLSVKRIVYIGAVIKTKGIEELLRAFKRAKDKTGTEYTLEIIGPIKKDYMDYLKTFDLEGVHFQGEKTHIDAMKEMAFSSIFVLPSYTEGFPNVILEAMALGKCIIASDVGAIPEILDNDCGFLIKSRDINSLTEALIEAISNPAKRAEYGRNAYKRVKKEYDISHTYNKYKSIWEKSILCLDEG